MFIQDPYKMSLAGYQLAGMMVENHMRVMLALTDATFRGKNPFVTPPVARRETPEAKPAPQPKLVKPQVAKLAKPTATPETVKAKRTRQPSAPPPMPAREEAMHPAE